MRGGLIAAGVLVVVWLVFMFTVVVPSHAERRESCEAKGGVIISKGDCVDKRYVL